MKRLSILLLTLLLIGGCSVVGKTPEPAWRSIKKDGNIEIRSYEPMIVAEVTTTGERYAAINDGFRILAGFIFGDNTVNQKIEMTAPVTQQAGKDASQKIPMTAPVTQEATGNDNVWKVGFVMPSGYTLETLPRPNDSRIKIQQVPVQQAAVIRFSGFNTDKNLSRHEGELVAWLKKNNIQTEGLPTYAFYNPPWTPPFMKRNEVMIRIPD
jgi:effector-binding domain-containing protein